MTGSVPKVVIVILAAAAGYVLSPRREPAAPSPAPAGGDTPVLPTPATASLPVSRTGCEAAACHGAPATRDLSAGPGPGAWASAATQWHVRDPHARAAEALAGPLAARIMDQLRESDPDRWAAEALAEARCLACHTNPSLAGAAGRSLPRARVRAEGVGCEACHGNAGGWLFEHAGWTAADRPGRYTALGMTRLYDLGERAATCAGCHVGAAADPARGYPLRDVNHELLAAGHPRLNFEFADSQRRLPPHWFERDRTRDPGPPRAPEFEARAWLVGRVAAAEAACALLADRAARATAGDADWPELSEVRCFRCHRELAPAAARAARAGRPAAWQPVWPVTRPEHLAGLLGPESGPVAAAVAEVAALQVCFSRREPSPAHTGAAAARAAAALRALRADLTALPDHAALRAVDGLYARAGMDALDWDETCQMAHGLASREWVRLRRAPPGQQTENPLFAPVFSGLTLPRPEGQDHFDSPRRFNPTGVKGNLVRLSDSVREGPGTRPE